MPIRSILFLHNTSLSTSLRIILCLLQSLLVFAGDGWLWLAAQAPLWLILGFASTGRTVICAAWAGANLTLVGALGSISYLGIVQIDEMTIALAVAFCSVFAVGVQSVSRRLEADRDRTGVATSVATHHVWLAAAVVLLGSRFVHGVPLLLGNQARLDGVAQVPALLGLCSGSIAIAAAFLRSDRRISTIVLQLILVLLVLGTASRLLFLFVAIGLLTSGGSNEHRESFNRTGRTGVLRAASVSASLGVVALIYRYRTPDLDRVVEKARATQLPPVAEQISEWFGTGIFLSARNGAAVYDVINSLGLEPPNGFIGGGLLNGVFLGQITSDPERWLTVQLGFSTSSVGATATPVWAGAAADFGLCGAIVFALLMGVVVGSICRVFPSIRVWLALVSVLSFYGSYFVSAQFIFTGFVLFLILAVGRRRQCLAEPQRYSGSSSGTVSPETADNLSGTIQAAAAARDSTLLTLRERGQDGD